MAGSASNVINCQRQNDAFATTTPGYLFADADNVDSLKFPATTKSGDLRLWKRFGKPSTRISINELLSIKNVHASENQL